MTRSLRLCLFLLLILTLLGLPGSAGPRRDIYPLSRVRAGQRAVGKSVFRGTKIEAFNLEIIGVLPKFDGSKSLILAKVLDGPVVARKSGVIGGMSGSPVYIEGKLAGAVALTWPWSKEPIAGITPIEDMLEAFGRGPTTTAKMETGGGELRAPVRVEGSLITRVEIAPQPPAEKDPPGVMTLVPLGGLVQVSGFNSRVIERLSQDLAPYGLRVAAGASGSEEKLRPPFVPGAALGARLIGGDLDMTALGTLTMIEDGKVLGFGHPLFQRGDVDLPMTGGYVYDIMPSVYVSNKVMAPTQVVGRVYHDHQCAIAGVIGGKADMLPVRIEAEDADSGRKQVFNVEIARLREMTPALAASAVVTAIDQVRGRVARGMARVEVELETADRKLVREEVGYSMGDAASAAAPAVMTPLAVFTETPFGSLRIERVRIKVKTEEARKTATIERITVNQARIKAGDTVKLEVTVRPYGEKPVQLPMQLTLPTDLPQGRLKVVVSGGGEAEQARSQIGAPRPTPVSLDQLIERYVSEGRDNELVLQAALTRSGVALLGEELPDLPRNALEALSATRPTDLRPAPSVVKIVLPTDWVLNGRQLVMLPVESAITGLPGGPKPPEEEPSEEPEGEGEEASVWSSPAIEVMIDPYTALEAGSSPSTGEQKEEKKPTPTARAPQIWTQTSGADYEEAKLNNLILSADGALSLGLQEKELAQIPAAVVWSLAVREGVVYVGTGNAGKIYRVSAEGELHELFATGEMNVHALAFDGAGNLYAGTSPRGKLFRISPIGEAKLIFDSDSTYLWALAIGADGTVYAAGGSPAKLYTINPAGEAKTLASLPVANALSLALSKQGEIYVGTAETGLIYRVKADGTAIVIGRVPGTSVDGLVFDNEGNLFATSSPGGEVYRITEGGEPELYLETGQRTVFGLAMLGGSPVVATGPKGLVIRAAGARKPALVFRPASGPATALATAAEALYAATSGPAALRRFGPEQALTGTLESSVLDAERPAKWGRVTWASKEPKGTAIKAETRSGDSPIPSVDWSQWEPALDGAIASPPARYLQYRLALSSETPTGTPEVQQVSVSRQPQNRPPAVQIANPTPGARLSGQQSLKWQGRDPDKDTLIFEVKLSTDMGKTWKALAENLREPKYDWDTKKQEDGCYLLAVAVSDRLSVPGDPQTGEASEVVWVDNTAPTVNLFRSSLVVGEDKKATISGLVMDALSPIRSVEYQLGSKDWIPVPITWVESKLAEVAITTDPLETDTQLTVRAFDAAGNVASDSVKVELKAAPASETKPEAVAAEKPAIEIKPEAVAAEEKPATEPAPSAEENADKGKGEAAARAAE